MACLKALFLALFLRKEKRALQSIPMQNIHQPSPLFKLPPELLLDITDLLPLESAASLAFTCRLLYILLSTTSLSEVKSCPPAQHAFFDLREHDFTDRVYCHSCPIGTAHRFTDAGRCIRRSSSFSSFSFLNPLNLTSELKSISKSRLKLKSNTKPHHDLPSSEMDEEMVTQILSSSFSTTIFKMCMKSYSHPPPSPHPHPDPHPQSHDSKGKRKTKRNGKWTTTEQLLGLLESPPHKYTLTCFMIRGGRLYMKKVVRFRGKVREYALFPPPGAEILRVCKHLGVLCEAGVNGDRSGEGEGKRARAYVLEKIEDRNGNESRRKVWGLSMREMKNGGLDFRFGNRDGNGNWKEVEGEGEGRIVRCRYCDTEFRCRVRSGDCGKVLLDWTVWMCLGWGMGDEVWRRHFETEVGMGSEEGDEHGDGDLEWERERVGSIAAVFRRG